MKSDFLLAFNEIAEMRKLPPEIIMEALQAALISAYRRNAGVSSAQNVEARIDEQTGEATIWVEKEVVDEVESEMTEISQRSANVLYPDAIPGDMVMVESTPKDFGRIAAQTAKQVILQRMREAEREAQYQEYQERIGDLITGTVQSDTGGVVTIGLGRTEAILPQSQQIHSERYRIHSKVRAYVMDVKKTNRGPQIIVSRTHRNMLRRLLEYEVPEIYNGTVEIKSIAREPGARSKVAVAALQDGADPVGACVGMRGVRIQSIVKELSNEKIDVIEWSPDQRVFISKALSPARVSGVFLDDDPDEGRTAIVVVPDDQLSLAIGREGQNARLAAKLTGWRIDIKSITEAAQESLDHIATEPELAEIATANAEQGERVQHIMEKKEANRPIMPEDYDTLIEFVYLIENYRLGLREAERAERRSYREAARDQVPAGAYQYPLDNTDLPLRVYNVLSEAGYETVGEIMEQYYLDPQKLLDLPGFGPAALEAVEEMINTTEFIEPEVEEAEPEVDMVAEGETEPGVAVEPTDEEQLIVEPVPTTEETAIETVEMVEQESAAEPVIEQIGPEYESEQEDEARARRAALVAQLADQDDIQLETEPAVEEKEAEQVGAPSPAEELVVDKPVEFQDDDAGPGFDDIYDEDEDEVTRRERDKRRRRQLIYDEELGRVVAKRRRKRSRGGGQWGEWDVIDDNTEL